MKRNFATPIDADILDLFKAECSKNDMKMNEVIEALMNGYVTHDIIITKKIVYEVKQKGEKDYG